MKSGVEKIDHKLTVPTSPTISHNGRLGQLDHLRCRTHPTLKFVDEMKDKLTYEGHRNDLEELEEAHLKGQSNKINDLLFRVQESQRMHDGDRSHPRLVELDAIYSKLTYDGWEEDFEKAVADHLSRAQDPFGMLKTNVDKMKRRQSMHDGDRNHPDLVFLYSLELMFESWEQEFENAMEAHRNGFSIGYHMFALQERQRMFEGDRSHPRLVALDTLKLSYPGWEEDANVAEKQHVEDSIFYNMGVHSNYQSFLDILASKQTAVETDGVTEWLHPIQKKILATAWSYPGFESDMEAGT